LKKVLAVFGTRPEAIKMAPLIRKLSGSSFLKMKVCVTAQHREMLDMVLRIFEIEPDYDLDLMSTEQSITEITKRVLTGMEEVLKKEKPDLVLVHGDTTTTMATSLAAFYQQVPVGHVEAGLRSGNIYSPYPEEMNRRISGDIAALHFAPTAGNRQNLLKCGVTGEKIFVTGNTVIDALHMVVKEDYSFQEQLLNELDYEKRRVILMTAHRRENWGLAMRDIFSAVKEIVESNPDVELVFPVHMNPVVRNMALEVFGETKRVHLIPPLDYEPFVNLMARSYLVLTDSGGLQEEAPALGKPVLVLRRETERPEAVIAGTVKIAGVKYNNIVSLTQELLDNYSEYEKMARAVNPYGDGHASERIVKHIEEWFAVM
jgi:UDP-N-acetylglucosamine 2-epimerase (non-hydrolysing)